MSTLVRRKDVRAKFFCDPVYGSYAYDRCRCGAADHVGQEDGRAIHASLHLCGHPRTHSVDGDGQGRRYASRENDGLRTILALTFRDGWAITPISRTQWNRSSERHAPDLLQPRCVPPFSLLLLLRTSHALPFRPPEKRDLSTQLLGGRPKRILIEKVELSFADNTSYVRPRPPFSCAQPTSSCSKWSGRYVLNEASFGRQKRYTATKLKED
jgi:hypothetical protein